MELVTRMFGEAGMGTCIVDEQRSDRTFYNASKGGRQFELVAWFDAEVRRNTFNAVVTTSSRLRTPTSATRPVRLLFTLVAEPVG